MQEIIEKAKENIVPIIEKLGYEVVDVECKEYYGDTNLTFYIYKSEGISIDDCELVNNALELPLEEFDITGGKPYVLNVSSPGLDRPIVSERDFERNMGQHIEIIFAESMKKKKKTNGILLENTASTVKILEKNVEKTYDKAIIKKVQLYIKF